MYRPNEAEIQEIVDKGGYKYSFLLVKIKRRYMDPGTNEECVRIQRWQLDTVGEHKKKPYLSRKADGSPDFVDSAWGSIDSDKDNVPICQLESRAANDKRFIKKVECKKLTSKSYPVKVHERCKKKLRYYETIFSGGEDYDVSPNDVFA